jgi:hypothetical protein
MSSSAITLEEPASSAAEDAPDPAVLRAERRLRLLEELAEIGMDLARSLRPAAQPEAGEAPAGDAVRGKGREPADVFGPLSRAIRLTLALEAKTDEELRDLKAGIVRARAEEQAQAAKRVRKAAAKARSDRIDEVRILLHSAAGAQIEDREAFEDIEEELEERLDENEADFGNPERPLRETVEGLCKAMGLSPDWSRWNGEDWAPDGGPFRPFVYAAKSLGASLAETANPPQPAPPASTIQGAPIPAADAPRPAPPVKLPPWRLEGLRDLE